MARGKSVVEISAAGESFFRMERMKCGKFGELSALPEKFRLHRSEDGCLAEIDSCGVIPFGCEYRVFRDFQITSGCAVLTTDVAAVSHGRVDGVELEPLVFAGAWSKLDFLVFGEKEFRHADRSCGGVIYSGSEPLLMVRVEYSSGRRCEMALGADVWRHRGAMRIEGARSEYELSVDGGSVRLVRRVLIYAPEVEPERRSWRYTILLGWDERREKADLPAGESFSLPGCDLNSSSRRILRDRVRRASGDLVWEGAAPELCFDSTHVGRAGKEALEHFDLEEILIAWRWANRQMRKHGAGLRVLPRSGGIFAESVILGQLSEKLSELV